MFRTLDRIYFTIKDRIKGYNSGYVDGIMAGMEVSQSAAEERLRQYDLHHADKRFQLGYAHAVAVVKGEIN
jgi:hypothetical protein